MPQAPFLVRPPDKWSQITANGITSWQCREDLSQCGTPWPSNNVAAPAPKEVAIETRPPSDWKQLLVATNDIIPTFTEAPVPTSMAAGGNEVAGDLLVSRD